MIYFLRHIETGLIKIGYTNNFHARFLALTGWFGVLETLGVMDGRLHDEAILKRQFARLNVRGILPGTEWFRPVPDLLDYIEEHAAPYVPARPMHKRQPPIHVINVAGCKVLNHLPDLVAEYEQVTGVRNAQREIAVLAGVSESTFSRYVNGKILGTVHEIEEKLCRYFSKKLGRRIRRDDIYSFDLETA